MTFFWSAEAGPCMMFYPRLMKLVDEYGGKFLLTVLNASEHKRFSVELGVTCIPSVRIYLKGQLVETIHGGFSELKFRDTLSRYLPLLSQRASDSHSNDFHEIWGGKLEQARKLLGCGQSEAASEVLLGLPEAAMHDPKIDLLKTRLELINLAHLLSNSPEGVDVYLEKEDSLIDGLTGIEAYRAAAIFFVKDDYCRVLRLLNGIINSDDKQLAMKAQKAKWAAFAIVGSEHELCHGEDPHNMKARLTNDD
ncbi:MAG: hypothetical protein GKR96_14095 [Gammaproteobacteria bacterium]|nr:hypothetical protein [Gammaproteobacteria bacterium]